MFKKNHFWKALFTIHYAHSDESCWSYIAPLNMAANILLKSTFQAQIHTHDFLPKLYMLLTVMTKSKKMYKLMISHN